MSRRENIFDTVDDLVVDFLYYDRKEDDVLGLRSIEEAIAAGEVTADEIVARFNEKLREGLR